MSPTVYLVTGAGRGLGVEFVKQLVARPDVVVFAGIRSFPATGALAELATQHPETVIPIKLTSANEEDNAAAAKLIKERVGKVDVIIANAGINSPESSVRNESLDLIRQNFETNTIGPVVLYQAFASLLSPGAKFVLISSLIVKVSEEIPFSYPAYAASKTAVNYIIKKINLEVPDLIAFPIHPGIVDTDMGILAAKAVGKTPADFGGITAPESVAGVLKVVDAATKKSHGGRFWTNEGEEAIV